MGGEHRRDLLNPRQRRHCRISLIAHRTVGVRLAGIDFQHKADGAGFDSDGTGNACADDVAAANGVGDGLERLKDGFTGDGHAGLL